MALGRKAPIIVDDNKEALGNEARGAAGGKALLITFLALIVLAGGFYGYLRLYQRKKVDQELNYSRRDLVRVKDKAENIHEHAKRIVKNSLERVTALNEFIQKIALSHSIADQLKVERPLSSRWKKSNYDESVCEVRFREKAGYPFKEFIKFLAYIERANPKVQVKNVNFGTRELPKPDEEDKQHWRVLSMAVRVFTPKEK